MFTISTSVLFATAALTTKRLRIVEDIQRT
jgi:hypothetical protein